MGLDKAMQADPHWLERRPWKNIFGPVYLGIDVVEVLWGHGEGGHFTESEFAAMDERGELFGATTLDGVRVYPAI